jgi:glycosyltransferase involved in cell wall biosynthesis
MKICHIISAFKRYDPRIFWKCCRILSTNGFDVVLLCNDGLYPEKIEGVQIIPSGFDNSSRIRRILFARSVNYKKAIEIDADLYQIHDPEFIPLGIRLKKRGKKVVYDSHEDFPRQILEKDWIPFFLRKIISVISEKYINIKLREYDAVITVTPHIAKALRNANDRIYVITNYPLVEDIPEQIKEIDYCSRKNVLCYTGTVYRSSLQENIFSAIRGMEDVEYKIIGNIEANYKKKLLDIIPENAELIDFVTREQLFDYYREMTVGIAVFDYSPNLGYRLGSLGVNKIFEYMYFGLPVICTDFILWKEIIDKYDCGILVDPLNADEIRNAILFLVQNKKEAYRMGQNALRAVLEQYNWTIQGESYVGIIKNLLEQETTNLIPTANQ